MAFTTGNSSSTTKDANGFWLTDTTFSSTQNATTNSSTITDGFSLRHASAGMFSNWAITRYFKATYTVNGGALQTKFFVASISSSLSMPSTTLALGSGTITVPHNSDGTQQITLTAYADANTNATYVPVNTTAGRVINLPTITPVAVTPPPVTFVNTYPNISSVGIEYSYVSAATSYGIYASSSQYDTPSSGTTPTITGASSNSDGSTYAYAFHYVPTGTVNYYWVRSQNSGGNSAWYPASAGAYGIAASLPSVVTGVNATQKTSDTSIDVTWTEPNNNGSPISQYEIQISNNSVFSPSTTYTTTSNSYDTGLLSENQTYYFRVRASNNAGINGTQSWQTTWSDMAFENVLPVYDFPSAPTSPTIAQVIDDVRVYFNWDVPLDDGGGAITGYNGQYATNSSFTGATSFTTSSSLTEFTTSELVINQTYYFRVRSTNARGDSPYTSTLNITIAPLSIPSTPPISVGMSQLETFLGATLTWGLPLDNGGDEIDGYMIHFANNIDFVGHTSVTLGLQYSYQFFALSENTTYYAKVFALNNAGYSIASDVASVTILPLTADLDGWTAFGTLPTGTVDANLPAGVVRKVILDVPTAALSLHKEVTTTATGGEYEVGTTGIKKTITGLVVGKEYRLTGRAVLTDMSAQINNYRLQVAGVGAGLGVTLSGTTLLQTIPEYEFVATATTHDIQIANAEALIISTTGVMESVAFNQISLVDVGTDSPYRLQDTTYNASLADHFDLATRSIGGAWWVDKTDKTKFASSFEYAPLSATFTDFDGVDGNLNYSDIKMGLKTKDVVNDIVLTNVGTKADVDRPKERAELNTAYGVVNNLSRTTWGTRRLALQTNLYTEPLTENLCLNPSFEYGQEGIFQYFGSDSFSLNRIKISNAATGQPNFMPIGITSPVTGDWALVMTGINNKQSYQLAFGTEGKIDSEESQLGFSILPSTQYTASVHWLAGVGNVEPSTTTQVWMRWFDARGNAIGNSSLSAALGMSDVDWVRNQVTATSPANAYYAQVRTRVDHQFASSVGRTGYIDNIQLNKGLPTGYVDGDLPDNDVYLYEWLGIPGQSASREMNNILDERANSILEDFSEPINQISSITWNAQDNVTIASNLDIGSRINITFNAVTNSYRIIGLTHEITPERWIMTIGVERL